MNVTRAAENLYMTQPAVSRSIREMEKHYGARLFERLNQRLYVTESGRRMHAYAVHIVDTFDRMEREMTDGDERGILRIGASITLGNYDLPALVQKMRQEKPQLRIQATVANAGTLEEMLLDNRLDIALIEGSVASDELVTEPFAQDKLLLILPPDHDLTRKDAIFLSDLMHYDLLLREKGSSGRAFLNTVFESQGLTLSPLWESASTQALVRAVAQTSVYHSAGKAGSKRAVRRAGRHPTDSGCAASARMPHRLAQEQVSFALASALNRPCEGRERWGCRPKPCLRDITLRLPSPASRRYEPIKHTTRMRVVP